jgi:hypothetical protein
MISPLESHAIPGVRWRHLLGVGWPAMGHSALLYEADLNIEMKFEYNLIGPGWAESTISVNEQSLSMTVSYLSDALGHLTKAVVNLLNGAEEAEVRFMDEPGEHHWLIRKRENDTVSIEIKWYEDWPSWRLENDSGSLVFAAEVSLWEFARHVRAALDKSVDKYGLEGYKKEWIAHKFPSKDYRILSGMLSRKMAV